MNEIHQPLDYERILSPGHVLVERLNKIGSIVSTFAPKGEQFKAAGAVVLGVAALALVVGIGTGLAAWSNGRLHKTDAPKPPLEANIPAGTFTRLLQGATQETSAAKLPLAQVGEILKPSPGASEDDVKAGFRQLIAGKAPPAGWVPMPDPGKKPSGDALSYKLVSTEDGAKVLFTQMLVQYQTPAGAVGDAVWLGAVHLDKGGHPVVCNFRPGEIAGTQLLLSAPGATCDVNESMIPRAASAAFGTPVQETK